MRVRVRLGTDCHRGSPANEGMGRPGVACGPSRAGTSSGTSPRCVLLAFMGILGLAAPVQAQFTREITLTVNGGVVTGGPHADFPVFVDHTDPELRCTPAGPGCAGPPGVVQSSGGDDIVFQGEDAATCGAMTPPCPLSHELQSYDGIAGRVRAWVRLPSLATGRVLHMYYGNGSITLPTERPRAVWDADYVGVWHLEESGTGNRSEYRDSSQYGNHGQGGQGDAPAVPKQVAGQVGNGQRFDNLVDGTYDFIDVGQDASLSITGDQITMEAWVWHNITIDVAHGTPPTTQNPYGILNHKGASYGGYSLWLHGSTFECPGPTRSRSPASTATCTGRATRFEPTIHRWGASPPEHGTTSWRPTTAPT